MSDTDPLPLTILQALTSLQKSPTSLDADGLQWFPDYSWDSEPMVCGWGATKTGHKTGIAKIEAGGTIGFRAFAASYKEGFVPTREVSSIYSLSSRRYLGCQGNGY
jgi:hypothetical protein